MVDVYGLNPAFRYSTTAPEDPGRYFFAPIASLIPAAARLMLALLERSVQDAGGTYALCDTDSMAIVSTKDGCWLNEVPVQALSWPKVNEIIERFKSLNPYDRTAVSGSVLKLEKENLRDDEHEQLYALCVAAKRYALFNRNADGTITIKKASKHGLGHLLDPMDPEAEPSADPDDLPLWIQEIWEVLIRRHLGENPELPSWIDRPALSRVSATSPDIVRRLNVARKRLPYPEQVKPANFVLAAHIRAMGHPESVDPEHFQLIAPYERDARKWLRLNWVDRYTGKHYAITTSANGDSTIARVKSYRDVLDEYATHPEPKSIEVNGKPCGRDTVGVLCRRPVRAGSVYYVGKESNFLEDVDYGMLHDLDEVQQRYFDPNEDVHKELRTRMKHVPSREISRRTGFSTRYVRAVRNGRKTPSRSAVAALLLLIDRWSTGRGGEPR